MTPQEIAKEILSASNKQRKAASRREREIYDEKIHQYVYEYLKSRYDSSTVREMPIISCISLLKKIVNKFASIYVEPPKRKFINATEQQVKQLEDLYSDLKVNRRMKLANRYYKLQNQTFMQFIVKDGVPILRNFNKHHIDVIPNEIDPEMADAYAVSSFNNYNYLIDSKRDTATGYIEKAATEKLATTKLNIAQESQKQDDMAKDMRIAVWAKDGNYIMDGTGALLTDVSDYGFIPFIDIHGDKDFKFFVDSPEVDADFCVQFNAVLTSIGQILEMQGFAVGYLISLAGTKTNNMVIGPNKIINLEIPEDATSARPEFGYASPNADLAGAMNYIQVIAQAYFWAKGLETAFNADGTQQQHPSGFEKLLTMIDEFKATQDDLDVFVDAETSLFEQIKNWARAGAFTNSKYKLGNIDNVYVSVEFAKPEVILTGPEKVDYNKKKEDAGYASKVDSIMDIYGLQTRDEAIAKLEQIQKDKEEAASIVTIPPTIQGGIIDTPDKEVTEEEKTVDGDMTDESNDNTERSITDN